MANANTPTTAASPTRRWRQLVRPIVLGIIALVFTVLVYFLPINYEDLGNYAYFGVFLVTALANATVIIPIPYPAVIARVAQQSHNLPLVIIAGSVGSVVGESVAFFIGRSGRGAVEDTRFYRWVQHQLRTPWRAFLILFLLAAPPNPAFDVAGLTAGALGVPFPIFFLAVLLGRCLRIWVFAQFGVWLSSGPR